MESLLSHWDGETVVVRHDELTTAWIFIAIHSTRLGPAVGGTRMKSYPDASSALEDALRLAAGMTNKFAVPGLPYGGGKAVIAVPHGLDPQTRHGLLERYGALVRQLGGLYYTAPDVGTSSADMDVIGRTGSPYVFARSESAGGAGSSGPATARGVFTGIQVACERAFGDRSLRERRVLVQGAGSVGRVLIELLLEAEARLTVTDVDENRVLSLREELGVECAPPDDIYGIECDVFSPCALGGVLNVETIPRLRCRVIAGGANNQLAVPVDAERLRARGILYAPDYVVNVGGAMAGIGMETRGWTRDRAGNEVCESVRRALERVFQVAEEEDVTTDAAALRIADERLSAAS